MIEKSKEIVYNLFQKSYIRSSSIYFFGSFVNGVLPLLLLPILTRYLTPTDYGIVATSLVLVNMLSLFVGFNTSGLIARGHFDNDFDSHQRLVSTNIIVAGIITVFLTLLLIVLRNPIGEVSKFPASWVPLMAVIAFFNIINLLYLTILQVREEPKKFVFLQILLTGLNLGIAIILVVGIGLDWQGRILATIIAGLIVTAVCFYGLIVRLGLLCMVIDRVSLKALLAFGIPLIPHFIGGLLMTMAPRLYLNNLASVADTGLYSVGYNVASPIALLTGAVNQAYLPEILKRLSSASTDLVRLARVLLMGAIALPILGLAYGLVASLFLPLIVGPKFLSAGGYILWLALAFAMQGVCFIFISFVIYSKKTHLITWRADFVGGIAMLILCPFLISLNGPIGAAHAGFLASAISCIGYIITSRKAYPMPWKKAAFSLLDTFK